MKAIIQAWDDKDDHGSLKLNLIEGEEIAALWSEGDHLFVRTTLDRQFKSTNAPIKYFDLIEEP